MSDYLCKQKAIIKSTGIGIGHGNGLENDFCKNLNSRLGDRPIGIQKDLTLAGRDVVRFVIINRKSIRKIELKNPKCRQTLIAYIAAISDPTKTIRLRPAGPA